jgi:hypothetical protein
MQYTNSKIEVTRGKIIRSERKVDRQRKLVEEMQQKDGAFADNAQALLLIMEQSLLSMTRFLKILEKDLAMEQGLASGHQKLQTRIKPRRRAQPEAALTEPDKPQSEPQE